MRIVKVVNIYQLNLIRKHNVKNPFTSHCWGAKIEQPLTTETLSNFLRSIQIAQLPANFRDAIYVTRQL